MKRFELILKDCSGCPNNCFVEHFPLKHGCMRVRVNITPEDSWGDSKENPGYPQIPEWCPLPDVKIE